MFQSKAYAAASATSGLAAVNIPRRDPTDRDVRIEILYCGICHSDLHQVRDEWNHVLPTVYPCVPGHEIVGRVSAVGDAVSGFAVGETVAVGPIVHNCGECESCRAGLEQYCNGPQGRTEVYNGPNKLGGTNTYGGCANF